jgi:hypothetical protein
MKRTIVGSALFMVSLVRLRYPLLLSALRVISISAFHEISGKNRALFREHQPDRGPCLPHPTYAGMLVAIVRFAAFPAKWISKPCAVLRDLCSRCALSFRLARDPPRVSAIRERSLRLHVASCVGVVEPFLHSRHLVNWTHGAQTDGQRRNRRR